MLSSLGTQSFWMLRAYMQSLDLKSGGEGRIDRDDLRDALINWRVNGYAVIALDGRYIDRLVSCIDTRKVGMVDWRDLVALVRGPLSDSRQDTLIELFSRMDSAGNGVLTVDEISRYFNGSSHPLVTDDRKTPGEALDHFISCCRALAGSGRGKSTGIITYEMFCTYFADLGATIDSDFEFDSLVRSHWLV